ETLPEAHPDFARVADEEATMHLALGFTDRALARYQGLLERRGPLAEAEPERADYRHYLSVTYNKVGDLYGVLGQGEQAREHHLKALAIVGRLAQAEPERVDYQRFLAVSLVKIGATDEPDTGERLQRALSILVALKEQERLAPVDEPMIPAV